MEYSWLDQLANNAPSAKYETKIDHRGGSRPQQKGVRKPHTIEKLNQMLAMLKAAGEEGVSRVELRKKLELSAAGMNKMCQILMDNGVYKTKAQKNRNNQNVVIIYAGDAK